MWLNMPNMPLVRNGSEQYFHALLLLAITYLCTGQRIAQAGLYCPFEGALLNHSSLEARYWHASTFVMLVRVWVSAMTHKFS